MVILLDYEISVVLNALRAAAVAAEYPTMAEHYADLARDLEARVYPALDNHETVTAISALLRVEGNLPLVAALSDRAAAADA